MSRCLIVVIVGSGFCDGPFALDSQLKGWKFIQVSNLFVRFSKAFFVLTVASRQK